MGPLRGSIRGRYFRQLWNVNQRVRSKSEADFRRDRLRQSRRTQLMWVYRESTSPMTQFRSWEAHTRISHRGSVRSDTDRRDEPGDTDGHSCPSSERVG